MKAVLNPNQVAEMAEALRTIHLRYGLLWELGITTGLRISDLLSLRASSVSSGTLTVTESKTKNVRKINLGLELFVIFGTYIKFFGLKDTDFLFFSSHRKKDKPMSRQWANRVIALTASKTGLESVGTQSMRKTYACNQFCVLRCSKRVQSDLGHKYESTTLLYLRDLLFAPQNSNP
jgi:integrase